MELHILGPVEGSVDGVQLALGGPRQRALLAYLALHANEVVSSDRLLHELWWEPPAGGTAAVQTLISRLRKAVGDRLLTIPPGYMLNVADGELDRDRLRSLLDRAALADPPRRARLLREAESLCRGEPLAGLDFPFVAGERLALEELHQTTVEERLAAEVDAGAAATVVPELTALIARDPLRERLRELLMLALYRAGRQSAALDVYRDTRRTLHDELGLEPGPELRRLEQAILRQEPSLAHRPARPSKRRRRLTLVLAVLIAMGTTVGALIAARGPSASPHVRASPFATMSAAAVAAAPVPTGWITIRDHFAHRRLNSSLWGRWGDGTGASLALRDGRVDVVLPANGRVGGRFRHIGSGISSECRLNGDFDTRVDYRLIDWPARSGARAQLSAWVFPDHNSDAARESAPSGERIDGDMPTSYNIVWAADRSGTLRLLRRSGRMVSFVWHERHWVELDSQRVTGQVQLGINLWADSTDWRHRRVEAAFDNFRLSAPRIPCG